MKIGYLGKGYPYKRCVINKTSLDYIWVNRRYNIPYAWYKVTSKIKEKILKTNTINWDKENMFCPLITPKCDVLHTFNTCCQIKNNWCVTFESTFPRTNNTVDRVWEHVEGDSYRPGSLTLEEAELSTKDNCKGIIALSQNALQIQKNMLKYFPQDIADVMMKKTHVLLPPQRLLISKEELTNKFQDISEKIEMVFIGNDFFRKGGAQLIDALESLRSDQIRSDQIRSEFHLTLISSLGYGDYASHATHDDYLHYKYKIEKSDWITWYQNVPNDQVIAMLKNMQVGFLPTLADTFGFSVLEMQAAGVPVVTTNVRAMPEINNTQCGWLCELPLNPVSREAILDENLQSCKDLLEKQLKTVLAEILTHPDEISSKAINSYERIEKYHDPIKYGQILEEIYYS